MGEVNRPISPRAVARKWSVSQALEKVSYFVHDPSPVTRFDGVGGWEGVDGKCISRPNRLTAVDMEPDLSETIRVMPPSRPLHEDQDKTIRRGPIVSGFTNKFKDFLRFG